MKLLKIIWITLIYSHILLDDISMKGQTMVADRAPICDNYLYIRGESNINEFSFYYNSINSNTSKTDSSDIMVISIPVREFEASNPMMYKDFLELMNEKKHPRIFVSISKHQLDSAVRKKSDYCPEISITIAGVTRNYTVDCMVEKCSDSFYLKGRKVVRLSDFRLKPPARLLGLIKVNNEIDVNFGFIITFTDKSQLSAAAL